MTRAGCARARSSRRSSPSTRVLVGVTALVAAVVARDRLEDATSTEGLLLLALAVLAASSCSTRSCCAAGSSRWAASSRTMEQRRPRRARHARRTPAAAPPSEVQRLTRRLQPHARPPRGRAPRRRPRRAARPGAGARADRPGPARRGQPGADRDPAAARGDDRATRRPSLAGRAAARPSRSPPRRWRSCCTSPASCARPRSTTTASSPALALAGRRLRRAHRHPRALPPPRHACRCSPTRSSSSSTASRRRACPTSPSTRGASRVDVELSLRRPHRPARHATTATASSRAPARNGAAPGGLGLSGMRERALLVGGHLTIFSEPGEGTTIELTMGAHMRILIADDHGIVRGGLKLLIDRQPDMEVVAEAEDGVEAFEQALATPPRPVRARRLDAAHDRPAGRAPDPRAPARDAGARALDARRRALRVRRAEGRRVRLRAQARGRPGAARTRSAPCTAARRS